MNIYDFDKTIYDGDSTAAFIAYCAKRYKKTFLTLLPTAWAFLLYGAGIYTKTQFKEKMYRFLRYIPDIDTALADFWDTHECNILDYYKKQIQPDDIIISASPEFLLEPMCKRLGIKHLIASKVDKHTGKYDGENCWGAEKVTRLYDKYQIDACDSFYSDSFSDTPLAEIAKEAFIVRKNVLTPWNEYQPSKSEKFRKMFFSKEFIKFVFVGVASTLFNVVFSAIYRIFIPDTTLAFLPGYITANVFSYLLNSLMTFKERLSFIKYIKYFISYIPNFIIQTIIVFAYAKLFPTSPDIWAYIAAAIIGVPVTFVIMKMFTFARKK
ncbi:MAG: haloacid dehalogenase-like hydrolase [Clostridia bacterium]|nr:haloacid dehalogenase-like hydrolase [Clostridia bacterium]